MARRHHRRRYHGLGDYVQIPGLSGVLDAFKGSSKNTDLMIGIGAGLVGTLGARYVVNKLAEKGTSIPMWVFDMGPLLGGAGAGVAAYMLRKKRNSSQAKTLLVGASLAGLTLVGWDLLKKQVPSLGFNPQGSFAAYGDYVQIPGMSGYRGVIVDNVNPGMSGVLVDNAAPSNLGALSALALDTGGEDYMDLMAA